MRRQRLQRLLASLLEGASTATVPIGQQQQETKLRQLKSELLQLAAVRFGLHAAGDQSSSTLSQLDEVCTYVAKCWVGR